MDERIPHLQDAPAQDGALERGVRQVGDTLHGAIEKVADPVYGAVHRASSSAHEGVDRVASSVQAAASKVDEHARRVRDTVLDIPHQAAEQARDQVRHRPLQAVALAFAVGWVIGRLGA